MGFGAFVRIVRGNYTRRFPSLVDRFYVVGRVSAESGARFEKDITGIRGYRDETSELGCFGTGLRTTTKNAEVDQTFPTYLQQPVEDRKCAPIFSLVLSVGAKPIEVLRIFNSANFTCSASSICWIAPFLMFRTWIDVLGAEATIGHGFAADAESPFSIQCLYCEWRGPFQYLLSGFRCFL